MKKTKKSFFLGKILTCVLVLLVSVCSAVFALSDSGKEKISVSASTSVDATDMLVLGDWGSPASESDLRYLWFMDYGKLPTSGYAEWWNDNGEANAALNNGIDIMEYIYIDGESTRSLVAKNAAGETDYKGETTQPHNHGGIYAPVGVFTNGSGVGLKVLLSYKTSFVLTVKAGFQITAANGVTYTISKDVHFQINEPGQGYKKVHNVSFNVTGRDDVKLPSMMVPTGTTLTAAQLSGLLANYDLSGYNYAVTVNGSPISSLTVTSDTTINVAFTQKLYEALDEHIITFSEWGTAAEEGYTWISIDIDFKAKAGLDWVNGTEIATAANNGCNLLKYIYISGKSAEEILVEDCTALRIETVTWTNAVAIRVNRSYMETGAFTLQLAKGFTIIGEDDTIYQLSADTDTYGWNEAWGKISYYTLSFNSEDATISTITVEGNKTIGELPTVPEKEGYIGIWAIDGKQITADTVYSYGTDKTATAVYLKDMKDTLGVDNWGTAGGADCTYLRVGNFRDASGNLKMSTAFTDRHWQDLGNKANENFSCDIMEYIYINGKSVRQISVENGESNTYGGEGKAVTFPFTAGGIYAPIDVYTHGTTFCLLIMTDYVASEDIVIVFKAGFMMATSDGTVLYLSEDVAFPYYTVTIDGETKNVLNGEKIEEPTTKPTKESTAEYDYTFDGWYNGDKKWDFVNDVVHANLELVAKFTETKRNYTVSFNVTGIDGIAIEPITLPYGTVCTASELTALFSGIDLSGYSYTITVFGNPITSLTVVSDVTVDIAFVEKVYYTVTIDGVEQTVEQGQKAQKPATEPTKESTAEYDYTFDGWYNGDQKWDFENDTVNGNLELVAKYTETQRRYTISFNITGNDAITLAPMTVKYGTTCTLSDLAELFRREDLSNYTYTVTVDGVAVTSLTVVSDVMVDITFVEKVYYTVTIDGVEQTVEQGQKVQKPATEPTKESTAEYDYTFDGWYNGDQKWDFENDTVNGNLELVAKFIETKKTNEVSNDSATSSLGCAGSLGGGLTAAVLLGVAAFGVIFKKKED